MSAGYVAALYSKERTAAAVQRKLCEIGGLMLETGLKYVGNLSMQVAGECKWEQATDMSVFERMLSEISATYINLSTTDLKKVLRKDFVRLSQALGVDGCILYIREEDRGKVQVMRPFVWFFDEYQESNKPLREWLEKGPTINSEDFHCLFNTWNMGKPSPWTLPDGLPKEAIKEKQSLTNNAVKSTLGVPISFAGSLGGVINVSTTVSCRVWPKSFVPRLRLFGEVFVNAIMRKKSEEKLQEAFYEIKELKERFEADYLYLKEEIEGGYDLEGIVGKSRALKKILLKVKLVAPTDVTVLILGETSTGKGLIARAVHDLSGRGERPLIQVNCAALAPNIIESELFGHEKGAFTGATARRLGRFETAKGTTLFLDEIGDLPLELQPKLLRVLEGGEFERMGGDETMHTDVRLIAATSRDLAREVAEGRFRSDLWYRLNIFPIVIPPLRDRLDDIPLFVQHFVWKYSMGLKRKIRSIPTETIKILQSYSWPGNIRELSNVIERAVITNSCGNLRVEIPRHHENDNTGEKIKPLNDYEREYILNVLKKTDWRIKGAGGAAQLLDINPETLRSRMKKLDIKRSTLAI